MREIKFRYWWNNKMYGVHSIDIGLTRVNGSMVNGALMQFTGLKDKNGREIYEGDIYNWFDKNDKEMFSVIPELSKFFHLYGEHVITPEYFEIIGNIYENPELIK